MYKPKKVDMIRNPEYFVVKGHGKLNNDEINIAISFEVFLINKRIVIYCYLNDSKTITVKNSFFLINKFDTYCTITGITETNQNFVASKLLMTQLNDKYIELISNSQVIIGSYFELFADKVVYPISNLFGFNFNIDYAGYKIVLVSEKNSIKKNISTYWEIPQIAASITLSKETESIENYTFLINDLIRLLSLATGRHLSISIQHFYNKDKDFIILQNNFSSHKGISKIIPEFLIKDFILITLPVIKEWNSDKSKDFRLILAYIDASDEGYLDDRLFMLIQSWEVFANTWFQGKYQLPIELKNLKNNLKPILAKWHTENPNFDKDKFWDNRIYDSLKWDKTTKTLEKTLEYYNLDNKKLNLNLEKLVKLRHKVAHKGRFGHEDHEIINDIIKCQFALRLLLLKLFNYKGKILDYRAVTKTHDVKTVDISEFEIE